jgi:hypothetical protein
MGEKASCDRGAVDCDRKKYGLVGPLVLTALGACRSRDEVWIDLCLL